MSFISCSFLKKSEGRTSFLKTTSTVGSLSKVLIALVVNPTADGNQVRHKTGNFTLDHRIVSQNDISFKSDMSFELLRNH